MGPQQTRLSAVWPAVIALSVSSSALGANDESAAYLAQTSQESASPADPQDRREPEPPIMRFDRDGDGRISRDEAPEQLKERFDRIDTNGDGFIDKDEARRHAEQVPASGRRRRDMRGGPWPPHRGPDAGARPTRTGLLRNEKGACDGYTLFAPMQSTTTYLIDIQGNVVHSWESDYPPGQAVYLLENGNLLRCEREPGNRTFHGGGVGGKIQEMEWDGTVVWDFVYADDRHMQHHDVEPLPNGNVLLIAWERKSQAEAIAAGRDPALMQQGDLWPDHIVEVKPTRPRGGQILWEWHVWDHLIQDHDPDKANFGVVADHPELVDINFPQSATQLSAEEQQRLEALGYFVPSPQPNPRHGNPDWNHTNSVAYNAELDQIVLSVLTFNEIWVIDHSTTRAQAAGHTGGRSGKGGDLLYRWGNPRSYRSGSAADQQLFAQHDARWIAPGLAGAGDLLVFNNGRGRPDEEYSSVDEIRPALDEKGRYTREAGGAFGPAKAAWVYTAPEKHHFHSGNVSGAQRLSNGNTLICSGEQGQLFEIDQEGKTVWEYVNPFRSELPEHAPGLGPGFPPGAGPGFPPGPPPGMGPDGPPGGPPAGRPGNDDNRRRRNGPPGGGPNGLFRATRLAPDYPGLAGKELKPSETQPVAPQSRQEHAARSPR
jgi:hypothetical protein